MSVEVQGLTKKFGEQIAVNNLNFSVKKGEILGFLGPNGAGKSTTMKIICGYLRPTSGSVSVCGYDILKNDLEARKSIGYLPEQNPLYEELYVREFLQFVASIHKLENKKNRLDEVIAATGLEKEQNKIIATLSKGYKQRVGLAQAIIHDPEVLILDEPTAGLDANQLVEIRDLIRELGKHKTLIFSSHIMQEVQALCDKVIIINDGNLVADSAIKDLDGLIKEQQTVYIEYEKINTQILGLDSLEGVLKVEKHGNGYILHSKNNFDLRPLIFRHAVANDLVIIEMKRDRLNVEDVFRKLTKVN